MNRWLLKAEPDDCAWEGLVADGRTAWTGVRNHQAAANLRAMREGDPAFFYRSGRDPAIVGLMRVVAPAYPDPTADDPRWVAVDVVPVGGAAYLSLKAIKADERFAGLALLRQPRLSVLPVAEAHWRDLCGLAGLDPKG